MSFNSSEGQSHSLNYSANQMTLSQSLQYIGRLVKGCGALETLVNTRLYNVTATTQKIVLDTQGNIYFCSTKSFIFSSVKSNVGAALFDETGRLPLFVDISPPFEELRNLYIF